MGVGGIDEKSVRTGVASAPHLSPSEGELRKR